MNKYVSTLVIISMLLCLFSSCSMESYDDGYKDGYNDGYDTGWEKGFDEGSDFAFYDVTNSDGSYEDGYKSGYDEGQSEVRSVVYKAGEYARKQTGWSVYEAWNTISIYNSGVDPDGYDLPTEEEYLQCIETLVIFSEYLENAGFCG